MKLPKRVFIIHGWGGNPNEGWFPWLKKELENKGFKVHVLAMPNTNYPQINTWVPFLKKQVKKADKNTYFIGHSIGCQTILRYLETVKEKVGGVIFIAGWFHLKYVENDTEKLIAKPWLITPINFNQIKKTTSKLTAIFSDNDEFVPIEDTNIFKQKLGAKIIIQKNKGHFSGSDKIRKLPIVLKEILSMSHNNS